MIQTEHFFEIKSLKIVKIKSRKYLISFGFDQFKESCLGVNLIDDKKNNPPGI